MQKSSDFQLIRELTMQAGNSYIQGLTRLYQRPELIMDDLELARMRAKIMEIFSTNKDKQIILADGKSVFAQLQKAIAVGTAQQDFPVGVELPDTWTDDDGVVYQIPHIIAGYRQVELAGDEKLLGAVLLRKYALPIRVPFSKNEETIYSKSDLHAWLNCDLLYGPLGRCGYESGCSAELLKSAAETVVYTPYKEDDGQSKIDTDLAKFFVPSAEELHIDIGNDVDLNELCLSLFKDASTNRWDEHSMRVFRDAEGVFQHVWLRSRDDSSNVCYAYTDGYISHSGPSYSCGVLPACVITGKE